MTIVCCWLDESYSRRRITAIADARAAVQDTMGNWSPLSDTTIKLFRISVKCHSMESFQAEVATWVEPHFQTEVGIGFAGYCFEALTVIALLSRALEQLVDTNGTKSRPEPEGVVNLAREIMERYFNGHANSAQHAVQLLIFGFSPSTSEPWCGKIERKPNQTTVVSCLVRPMTTESFCAIGDVAKQNQFRTQVNDLRRRIARHRDDLKPGTEDDAAFNHALEVAHHHSADKKIVEDLTLNKLDDQFITTVGGVLQKIEVYETGNGGAIVSFSRDDQPFLLDGLPNVSGDGLSYVPIGEKMGRK